MSYIIWIYFKQLTWLKGKIFSFTTDSFHKQVPGTMEKGNIGYITIITKPEGIGINSKSRNFKNKTSNG